MKTKKAMSSNITLLLTLQNFSNKHLLCYRRVSHINNIICKIQYINLLNQANLTHKTCAVRYEMKEGTGS